MQPNGANLTGGGTGEDDPFATPTPSSNPYVPFNGIGSGAARTVSLPFPSAGVFSALVFGAVLGALSLVARL